MRRLIALGLACLIVALACPGGARATALPTPPPLGTPVAVPGNASPIALACGAPTSCLALGQDEDGNSLIVPIDAGVPGPAVPVPAPPAGDELTLSALACGSASLCEAVGSLSDSDGDSLGAVVTIRAGQPGAPQIVTDPNGTEGAYDELDAVGCPSPGVCEAVGEGEDAQSTEIDDGTPGPLAHDQDPEIEELDGIVCAAGSCSALGAGSDGTGIIVPVSGGTLGDAQSVADTATLSAAGCVPGGSSCEVLGSDERGRSLVFPDNGGGLGPPARLPGELTGIACPTTSSCAALGTDEDGGGIVVPFAGPTMPAAGVTVGLQTALPLDPAGAPVCVSATSCLAIGSDAETGDPEILPFGEVVTEVALNVGAVRVSGTTVSLPITCAQTCAGRIRETATVTRRGSTRARTVGLAAVRFSLAAPGTRRVSVRLDAAGRRDLAVDRHLPVQLEVLTAPAAAGARPQIAAIRSATLRAHRRG